MLAPEDFPKSYEAEQALLAAAFKSATAYHIASDVLTAEDFADGVHGRLWTRLGGAISEGVDKPAMLLLRWLLADENLTPEQCREYAPRLLASDVNPANAGSYASQIAMLAHARRAMQASVDVIECARRVGVDTTTDELVANLERIVARSRDGHRGFLTRAMIAAQVADALKEDLPVFTTGLPCLDAAMGGGLFPGKLYGLKARRKVGKTSLLQTICTAQNRAGHSHLFLWGEMTPVELMQREMSSMAGINSSRFLEPDWRRSNAATEIVGSAALEIVGQPAGTVYQQSPNMTIDTIRADIARAVALHGIKGVVIDYLQIIGGMRHNQSSAAFYDEISRSLAGIAKRFNVWIVVAMQENQTGNIRWGEGFGNDCDMLLRLNPCETDIDGDPVGPNRWVKIELSRFTRAANIGSSDVPSLSLDLTAGPLFVDCYPASMGYAA